MDEVAATTVRRASREHAPRLSAELRARGTVKPLELFIDLVFVLGFTERTALMPAQPNWPGIGRAMLVLAMVVVVAPLGVVLPRCPCP